MIPVRVCMAIAVLATGLAAEGRADEAAWVYAAKRPLAASPIASLPAHDRERRGEAPRQAG